MREDSSRRALLAGAAGAVAASALAGCQTYGADSTPPAPRATGGGGAAADTELAKVADIPVGGGKVFDVQGVVLTQPAAGTIKAFSAVCTHQGCTVGSVSDGKINCPCHGSSFNAADGSVASGPATRPLSPVQVKVEGGSIKLA